MNPPTVRPAAVPVSAALQRRVAVELIVLCTAATLFLLFAPHNGVLFAGMAMLFLGYIGTGARRTRTEIWGEALEPAAVRRQRAAITMLAITVPAAAALLFWGMAKGNSPWSSGMLAALPVYFLWALVQQTIFLFYFLGRLRALWPRLSAIGVSMLGGAAFGLVHLPEFEVVFLTLIAGVAWSYCYLRDRALLPVAASHAVLGTGYYYWIIGRELFSDIPHRIAALS